MWYYVLGYQKNAYLCRDFRLFIKSDFLFVYLFICFQILSFRF